MRYTRGTRRLALIAALAWLAPTGTARAVAAQAGSVARPQPPRPPMVAGELLVRLRADFPACAHCLVAEGRGLSAATGSRILDQVRLKHRITAMEPVFGGVHAAERRTAAQRRYGRAAMGAGAGAALPSPPPPVDLSQIYLVRVRPGTDLLALAAEFRRDPNVVSAEPNYLYSIKSAAPVRRSIYSAREGEAPAEPRFNAPEGSAGDSEEGEAAPPFPNDPFLSSSGSWGQDFPDLWGLYQIEAPAAWERSQGEGVIVAVIDTGLDVEHPDLAANVWHNAGEIPGNGIDEDGNGFVDDVDGWDFTTCQRAFSDGSCFETKEPGPDVIDEVGHGTHIAGTIAAVGDNDLGIIGVAPKAQVMAVKGLNARGQGRNADLAVALVYAAENGAQVINASWSGPPSDTIKLAIDYVTETFDVVVVAAAGNDAAPLERGAYPANLSTVLAVGATTHTGEVAAFSNFGGPLDLVAPGGGDTGPAAVVDPRRSILSLVSRDATGQDAISTECREVCCCRVGPPRCGEPECQNAEDRTCEERCTAGPWVIAEDYVRASGTSFAAPHVAGTAALVRSRHPGFSQAQVRQVLRNTTDDLGPSGWDEHFGYGRVNAAQSVAIDDLPVAELLTPENRGKVWERDFPLAVIGTVRPSAAGLTHWRLTIRPQAGGNPVEVASGSSAVVAGPLGTVDLGAPLALEPGQRYVLDLTAEDTAGHVAHDCKMFLIPNPQYAAIPVPDPFDEGGGDATLSADGQRLALGRVDRDAPYDSSTWIFHVPTRRLGRIPNARDARLSPDGRFLFYRDTSPIPYYNPVLRHLDFADTPLLPLRALPLNTSSFSLSTGGARLAFLTGGRFDPSSTNADGSIELFVFDTPDGPTRQLTDGPTASFGPEIQDLVMTPDSRWFAFSAQTDLDPTATANGMYQAFLYDDDLKTIRQLSGRSDRPMFGLRPTVSADGALVAFESEGIFVTETNSGSTRQVFDQTGYPTAPLLSANGTNLAFVSAVDVDPSVVNEDLSPEVFLVDLLTGSVAQVTDTINFLVVPYDSRMDGAGDTFLMTTSGEINGTGVQPSATRWIKRRESNRPPILEVPGTLLAQERETLRTALRATDPDGDAIVFHVQRLPPYQTGRLRDLAASELRDHGDGTADLFLTPRYNEAGTYPLRIAAFDEGGGVDVRDVTLIIEDSYVEGDANCDGQLTEDDILALVSAIFDPRAHTRCVTTDTDDNGRVTSSDLTALLENLRI